jgi:hypothetical protein
MSPCNRTLSEPGGPIHALAFAPESGKRIGVMQNPYVELLVLIPASLALTFMIWVFWMFLKASGRR